MALNYAGMKRDFGNPEDPEGLKRCAARLLKIRERLSDLRSRRRDHSLLLATWNIRDFDSGKFGFGRRLPESYYYIAEMMSCFDLVAVQEINHDLSGLQRLMRILGREWDYIVTDTTASKLGGNDERMAFVYNTEKVWFRKIAGEIVLPEGQLVVPPDDVTTPSKSAEAVSRTTEDGRNQFARSPFLVAFQSGWFKFSLCTVHIYFGADSGAKLQRRIAEIAGVVKFLADRQDADSEREKKQTGTVENYIALGDFNVVSEKHKTMAALKSEGFEVPPEIDGSKVRKEGDHFYDQIAVRVKDERFKVLGGGMIDIYEDVFTAGDRGIYEALIPSKDPEKDKKYRATTPGALYEKWRTWQMSDHSPLWIEIATDFIEDYLTRIVEGRP